MLSMPESANWQAETPGRRQAASTAKASSERTIPVSEALLYVAMIKLILKRMRC
jgi:hypothetical protein